MQLVALAGVISASVAEERGRARVADPLEVGRNLGSRVADPTHAALTKQSSGRHHEARAFGDKADSRKAPLDVGASPRGRRGSSGKAEPTDVVASPPPTVRGSQRRGSLTKRADSGIVKARRNSTKTRASIASEIAASGIHEENEEDHTDDRKESGHRAPTPT